MFPDAFGSNSTCPGTFRSRSTLRNGVRETRSGARLTARSLDMADADLSRAVRFGLFGLDLRASELRKNGVKIPRCHTTANPLAGRTPTHEHLCRSGSGAIRRRHDGCLDYRTFADRLSKSYLANLGDAVQGGKAQAATANRSGTQRGCRRRGIDLAVGQSHTDRGTHGLFAYRPKSYGGNL